MTFTVQDYPQKQRKPDKTMQEQCYLCRLEQH